MNQFFLQGISNKKVFLSYFVHRAGINDCNYVEFYYIFFGLYRKNLISIGDCAYILELSMELGHIMWYTMSRLSSLVINPEINDRSDAQPLIVQKGEIKFDKVHFHYKGAEPIFEDKSIIIKSS